MLSLLYWDVLKMCEGGDGPGGTGPGSDIGIPDPEALAEAQAVAQTESSNPRGDELDDLPGQPYGEMTAAQEAMAVADQTNLDNAINLAYEAMENPNNPEALQAAHAAEVALGGSIDQGGLGQHSVAGGLGIH